MCIQCAQESALEAMRAKATELSVHGVSVLFVAEKDSPPPWTPVIDVVGRFIDEAEATAGWSETGANYLAIAVSKVAESLETGQPSGSGVRPARKGEFGYRGSLPQERNGLRLVVAFSGGTEEEDSLISQAGLAALNKGLDEAIREQLLAEQFAELIAGIAFSGSSGPRKRRKHDD